MTTTEEPSKLPTAVMRAPRRLVEKINLLARVRNVFVSEYVASRLGEAVNHDWESLPPEVRKYLESQLEGN